MITRMLKEVVERGLNEDLHYIDLTTDLLIPAESVSKARIAFKEEGILCGIPVIETVFEALAPGKMRYTYYKQEGDMILQGEAVAEIEGPSQALLKGERLCLNLMQRMSGIATVSRRYADAVRHTQVKIVDTRKTTPGLRALEKYAVRCGGCFNHRFNLSEGVLIKDNHIQACGGIREALEVIRDKVGHTVKLEIEVQDLKGLEVAIAAGADIVMLDNMSAAQVREAVALNDKRVVLEASGGVTLETLKTLAETGVDVISSGALTHSARALDIHMKFIG
ncbi:carboxylating nicotinate-nucleotide diphosphorylase [Acidaminobacter hydrogenoformans]|uniref:Probable nicotinate-nucleotide pyrophosphorylase [carboxylating] n=1 Tax=Acidaminobacter hydrogenoformans DSM 2784 TaxID=1120920 RepID=A0A1G5S0J8_9FIRM|nr:carboxylating nicotinate-nucleotide diphosphorylase [Acidaminobacter hydrogenoformans]SCZ79241.1 nicotinate-nucleotide pyrophosphorylase [carboxylating] [Acidaminobacter hydrogenoformans DSM 2784]